MDKRKIIEIVVFALWFAIAVLLYFRTSTKDLKDNKTEITQTQIEAKVDVKKITVIDGNTFDLSLNDHNLDRVLAVLPVKATTEAKIKVIDLLNTSSSPKVILKTKTGDRWLVEIFFNNNGKEHSMSEWLVQNNLVYK